LFNFMNNKCSLVNKSNPCSCSKKTKGFIKVGYVNPDKLEFNSNFITKIQDNLVQKSDDLDNIKETYHTKLFQEHPFEEPSINILNELLNDEQLKSILRLKE
ncbi:hypothetical protein, partial [Colwellia sp. E150_009]